MHLNDWEVWHTYSFNLGPDVPRPAVAAHRLVAEGLVAAAVERDGTVHCFDGRRVRTIEADVRWDEFGGAFAVRAGETLGPLASDGLAHWAAFRVQECRLLGTSRPLPPPYVRARLADCVLSVRTDRRDPGAVEKVLVEPALKLFDDGILLLELCVRNGVAGSTLGLREFIDRAVRLHMRPVSAASVPLAVARLAEVTFPSQPGGRWARGWRAARSLRAFSANHPIAQVPPALGEALDRSALEPSPKSLSELAVVLCGVIQYALHQPRRGAALVLAGPQPIPVPDGAFVGRPHVHILRHHEQGASAAENEAAHRDAFARILVQNPERLGPAEVDDLPRNLLTVGYGGGYVGPNSTLWVWAADGIRRLEATIPQREGAPDAWSRRSALVFRHQVLAEALDYGYIAQRRLAEVAPRIGDDVTAVLDAHARVLTAEFAMRESNASGEIADLLSAGWERMGVPDLRAWTRDVLTIQHAAAAHADARRTSRWAAFLTVFVGLLSAPSIVSGVLEPLWRRLGWWASWAPEDRTLALTGIAVAALLAGVYVGASFVRRPAGTSRPGAPDEAR